MIKILYTPDDSAGGGGAVAAPSTPTPSATPAPPAPPGDDGTPAAPPPPGSLLAGSGGDAVKMPVNWRESLPQEYRSNPSIAHLPSVEALAKSYIEAQGLIGKKRIGMPEENWQKSDYDEFHQQLGRPAEASLYEVSPTTKLTDGLELNADGLKGAKEKFFELGLSAKQGQGILDLYYGVINESDAGVKQAAVDKQAQSQQVLQDEYGDAYGHKLDVANSVLKQYGGEALIESMTASGFGDNAEMIKMLVKVGEGMLEDTAHGTGAGKLTVGGPSAALAEIGSLRLDAEFQKALNDRQHSGHAAALQKWEEMHKLAYPE